MIFGAICGTKNVSCMRSEAEAEPSLAFFPPWHKEHEKSRVTDGLSHVCLSSCGFSPHLWKPERYRNLAARIDGLDKRLSMTSESPEMTQATRMAVPPDRLASLEKTLQVLQWLQLRRCQEEALSPASVLTQTAEEDMAERSCKLPKPRTPRSQRCPLLSSHPLWSTYLSAREHLIVLRQRRARQRCLCARHLVVSLAETNANRTQFRNSGKTPVAW